MSDTTTETQAENTGKGEEQPAEKVEGQEPEETTEQGEKPDNEQASSEESTKEGDEEKPEDESTKLSHEDAISALTKTRTEAASWRTKYRDLEKKLDDAKTPEQVEEIVAGMKAERETSERTLMVENVALKHRLPEDLAQVLTEAAKGKTREELEAHATVLAKYAPTEDTPDADTLGGGLNPSGDDGGFDPVAAARKARSRRY